MSLAAGARIAHYEIVALLGAGGMGEVYLADDTRLRRRVALKVLPPAAQASGAERLLREARAAARLDHPNICTIFETGEGDAGPFIAMQFIEGETLAARLQRGPLSTKEAISIASQAAHALAEAHRQGIVHRDIKPQNIMITTGGVAKVLDFGLAQGTGPANDQETTAARLTEVGAVAGTIKYMSPEQLKGSALDERSDIFSLGTVLYEMVGRSHPFGQESSAETIASILTRDPRALPDTMPAELRRVVFKCLEKDRDRRYQTARDLAVDLEALSRTESSTATAAHAQPSAPSRPRRTGVWIGGAIAVAAAIAAALWLGDRPAPPATISDFVQLTSFSDSASAPALSPDGTMVAFVRDHQHFLSRSQIYVKRLPNGEAKQLTNDQRPKYGPVFTPDGNSVVYTVVGDDGWSTWKVPVGGGDSVRVLPNSAGLSWIDDKRILFSEIKGRGLHMGVVTSTLTRAAQRELYFPPHERAMAHYSAISPDRKSVLVVEMDKTGGWDGCRLLSFEGQSPARPVGPPSSCTAAAWSPDGRWMYFAARDEVASHLWRQRFPDGKPEPLTSGTATDEQGLAVDPDGKWIISSVGRRSSALWVRDSNGERLVPSEGFVIAPVLTADGKRAYCLLQRAGSPRPELVTIDLDSGRTETVLPDVPIVQFSISSDDRSIAYTATGDDGTRQVWTAAVDRTSAPRLVVSNADSVFFGGADELFFRSLGAQANYVERIKRDGSGRRRILDRPIIAVTAATPGGEWVIVQTQPAGQNLTGGMAIHVADGVERYLCIRACSPSWSPDRRFMFINEFVADPRTMVVPVPAGRWFPDFPEDSRPAIVVWNEKVPGVQSIDADYVVSGSSPSRYVLLRRNDQRNLFRIPLR